MSVKAGWGCVNTECNSTQLPAEVTRGEAAGDPALVTAAAITPSADNSLEKLHLIC